MAEPATTTGDERRADAYLTWSSGSLARTVACTHRLTPEPREETVTMFIAMNRFRVRPGAEGAFEQIWLDRETHLETVPGFIEFHLLRGPRHDDHTLYSSHTVWQSRAAFEDWTRSEAFRAAHKGAGGHEDIYLGHPNFEGFEAIQTVTRAG